MIGRRGALRAGLSVEIELADIERVLADGIGDFFDETFSPEHALRTAETTKGGVGDRMGFKRPGGQMHMRIEIAGIGMEQRTVGYRA
ncbi:hypothetical protein D3C80_1900820 [compost metagenome]